MPGDLLLLPSGIAHRLASDQKGRCRPFDRKLKEETMSPEGDLITYYADPRSDPEILASPAAVVIRGVRVA